MKRLTLATGVALCLCFSASPAASAETGKPPATAAAAPTPGAPQTDDQKSLYAIGLSISRDLGRFALTAEDIRWIEAGLEDGLLKREKKVDLEAQGPKVNEFVRGRIEAAGVAARKAGDEYIAKAAAEPGAVKTPSGLVYTELRAGSGASPKDTDRVKVHYEGRLIDGTVFDSSLQREPAEFQLTGVVKCWTEGVARMKVGGKSRLVCPADLGWGDRGAGPDIGPGATVVFEVELLAITTPPPAAAPAAPGAAPEAKPATPPPPPQP